MTALKIQVILKEDIPTIRERFHELHAKTYGHSAPKEKIQVVNLCLRATKLNPKPEWPKLNLLKNKSNKVPFKTKFVYFEDKELESRVYERSKLPPGSKLKGSAIIQEKESTTLVGPSWLFRVDEIGNLHLLNN